MSDGGLHANGFPDLSAPSRVDVHRVLSVLGPLAGLTVPLLGIAYGVVRVGYEQFYRPLGLSPELVGLSQAAIVGGVAVVVGSLAWILATWVMFGVVIYRLIAPLRSGRRDQDRSRRDWVKLVVAYLVGLALASAPAAVATLVAGGRGLALWASGAVIAGVIALELSWMLADPELRLGDRLQQAARSTSGRTPLTRAERSDGTGGSPSAT